MTRTTITNAVVPTARLGTRLLPAMEDHLDEALE
jgi:UTP-glucose-1-phosphate uridylyltransferase